MSLPFTGRSVLSCWPDGMGTGTGCVWVVGVFWCANTGLIRIVGVWRMV